MFIVSEKKTENGLLIVVTDSGIIGKVFEEGNRQLDLTKKFYQGEKKNKEEVVKIFEKARHIHLTGKEAVAIGVELDLVKGGRILIIGGVPHAEILLE